MNISCRWKWPLLRYMIMDKDHKMQDLMQRSKWLRYFAATALREEKSPPFSHAHTDVSTCLHAWKHIVDTYIQLWRRHDSRHWRLSPCWGAGEAGVPLCFLWVWWSWWTENTDTWSTRTRKRCFQVWLYCRSTPHSHSNERKEQKKKVEVEDEMRILQQSLENERWGRGNRRRGMSLSGKSCPQDIRDRVDSYEYCMIWNTGN